MYVNCCGLSSLISEIEMGVSQGSILSPLLFTIYMKDIHTANNNLNVIFHADSHENAMEMLS